MPDKCNLVIDNLHVRCNTGELNNRFNSIQAFLKSKKQKLRKIQRMKDINVICEVYLQKNK